MTDLRVENHGSIFRFIPLTDFAREWIGEHVSEEGYHPAWPELVVEHRYAADLAQGMAGDGLILE